MPMRCAACRARIPDTHRFCGACGAPAPAASQLPTATAASIVALPGGVADTPVATGITAGDPAGARGFTPGTLIAGRYRVIGLLGHGGMGEVYRADDLKLGQPVALKFLPHGLARDRSRRDRLLGEVRIARQVSHPNVCRVYDIGEFEGEHFLSMEYIDGEDLGSLLRRIGRLPADKALDIARQISAGLAAAHARNVIHRDLKPANVMLDGRGRVRITDFGLASAGDPPGAADLAGTPAYMAPEQLAGRPASVRSDIYALGLLLYELYTGTPAFSPSSLAELLAHKEQGAVTPPSEIIDDLDPAIERVIMRATAPDPRARPESVAHLAASLPGGSLLEAVLRAGETPSPELVAASGPREGLMPAIVWALVALLAVGATSAVALGSSGLLWLRAAPTRSPEVLADRARELLAALGHPQRPADRASGFEMDLDYLRYLQAQNPSGWRASLPDPSFIRFWYRDSPRPLEAWRFPFQYGNVSRVTPADPPLAIAGMTLVRLDPGGRLTHLVVVPASAAEDTGRSEPDWPALLARAGFDSAEWKPADPQRTPPVFADARAAWAGFWPGRPDLAVQLEAAALGGKIVYFQAVHQWTPPARAPEAVLTTAERLSVLAVFAVLGATIVAAAVVARRNLRAGRGDQRGALRLSMFVFAAMMVSWFVGESHVATLWEIALLLMALSWASLTAGVCWLAYLAAEPFLRRHWPEVLVSWTRLLAGQFRDPIVGRDVLVGCAAGSLLAVIAIGGMQLQERLGLTSDLVFVDVYGAAYGLQKVVPLLVWRAAQGVFAALACLFILLLLRLALGSQWAAVTAFVAAGGAIAAPGSASFLIGFTNSAVLLAVFGVLLARFGLLAAVVQFYVWGLFIFFPITTDLGAWHAGAGITALAVFAALALFGLTAALHDGLPAA
jgi:serine/threonine-protein kinase